MKKFLSFLLGLSLAFMASAQIQDPAKWSFQVKDLNETESELIFTAQLDQGWHIYSQHTDPNGPFPIAFEFTPTSDYKLIGPVREPKPHEEFDKDFNCTVRSFEGRVVFRQKIQRLAQKDFTVKGTYSYQLCNNGSCIAPDDRDFSFKVTGAKAAPADNVAETVAPAEDTASEALQANEDTAASLSAAPAETEPDQPEGKKQSLIVVFLLALLGGVLTMFTPCVFPMIPMTVNFFMNSTDNKRASRRQAWFFGFSIVFLFAILGAILTLIFGPEALYFIGTHWVPNLIFFVIFLIFSLSFFGLFEIKMPEKWINKSDE